MSDGAQDFVNQFVNLEGNTVGERKKSFYKLLRKENLFTNEQDLNRALKLLQPKTYLENLLYVDALLFFKRTPELLEIFKQGNEVHISKIIKQCWFFKEVLKGITIEEFIHETLQRTSFAIRVKVLKKLSIQLNEGQMNKVFDCVLERYGLHMATRILHACSSKKVIEILSDYEIILQPSQVRILIDKNITTFKYYLEYNNKMTPSSYSNSCVIKHLATKYPEEMLKLKKERKISDIKLGRRTSKKIMNLVKKYIIEDINYYVDFLDNRILVRKLHDDFRNIYFKLFPTKINVVNSDNLGSKLLEFYPKERQWGLFEQTFYRMFRVNVTEDLLQLEHRPMLLCSDKKVIETWAALRYQYKKDDNALEHMEITKAISIIKERIKITPRTENRLLLLHIMVNVCARNKDLKSLEEVLEYFCSRHTSEKTYVRISFLKHIHSQFKLDTFTENHWGYINKQINILKAKDEFTIKEHGEYIKRYVEYLFKNEKPFQPELMMYIKHVVAEGVNFLLEIKNPPVEREIFIQIVTVISSLTPEESKEFPQFNLNDIYKTLILDIISFSLENTYIYINLLDFPFLINYVRSIGNKTQLCIDDLSLLQNLITYNITFLQDLIIEKTQLFDIIATVSADKNNLHFVNLIEKMICKQTRSELENDFMLLYFDKVLDNHISHRIHYWFIKNEPQTVVPYIDKIIAKSLYLSPNISTHVLYLKEIKLLSHFSFDIKYIDFYKSQLKIPKYETKDNIKLLSLILDTQSFITLIEKKYFPETGKLNLVDEETKRNYSLQCNVAKLLKDVEEPSKMLPIVMLFCVDNYLGSVLHCLYSICYRSPEIQLPRYLSTLLQRDVSIRKHAIYLSYHLLNSKSAYRVISARDERNTPAQKHLFSATSKYFVNNPSHQNFNRFIYIMTSLNRKDKKILEKLTSTKVPRKYQAEYLEKCWRFFENLKSQISVNCYLNPLLEIITGSPNIVNSLSQNFCKDIINGYFREQLTDLSNLNLFACQVLRYKEDAQVENFDLIFSIIRMYKITRKRKYIENFFDVLYSVACSDICGSFIQLCNEYWIQNLSPLYMFDAFLLLRLLVIKFESVEPFTKNFAKNVAKFLEELIMDYGPYVYNKFKYALVKVHQFENIKEKYSFLYYLLNIKDTPEHCILVVDLMDQASASELWEAQSDIKGILQILRESDEPIVLIYYNYYINQVRDIININGFHELIEQIFIQFL